MYGALTDVGGTVLDEVNIGRHGTSGDDGWDRLVTLIDTIPLQWKDFPLKGRLGDRYGLLITIENDVNLAALGELWFGAGQNPQNMILIAIGTGTGAAIIIDAALYRRSTEASGEVDSMLPGRGFPGEDFRDFETLERLPPTRASPSGRARSPRPGVPRSIRIASWPRRFFDAARQGPAGAWGIITETVDLLAVEVANLTAMFDPEAIVLGGRDLPFSGRVDQADHTSHQWRGAGFAGPGNFRPGAAGGCDGCDRQCAVQNVRLLSPSQAVVSERRDP
jgi:predicted NBD/HSP70 family sugar kinase